MWKARQVLLLLGIQNPSEQETKYVYSVLEGGKSDMYEKSRIICSYFDREEMYVDVLNMIYV